MLRTWLKSNSIGTTQDWYGMWHPFICSYCIYKNKKAYETILFELRI